MTPHRQKHTPRYSAAAVASHCACQSSDPGGASGKSGCVNCVRTSRLIIARPINPNAAAAVAISRPTLCGRAEVRIWKSDGRAAAATPERRLNGRKLLCRGGGAVCEGQKASSSARSSPMTEGQNASLSASSAIVPSPRAPL